jgi:hypothetical protein
MEAANTNQCQRNKRKEESGETKKRKAIFCNKEKESLQVPNKDYPKEKKTV